MEQKNNSLKRMIMRHLSA